MTDEARLAAKRLFEKLTRENKSSVKTVGIGKSYTGREVLFVFCSSGDGLQVPEVFDGFGVFCKTSAAINA